MSIIKLKIEATNSNLLKKEYAEYKKAIQDFEKEMEIDPKWFKDLYALNKLQWDVMDELSREKQAGENLEKIGRLFIKAEKLNKQRNSVKNKIVERTAVGFKEIEMN